ncbi:ATP-dependent zinc protease [Polaribacter gangjinensis]|uniref:Peptidase n=1 Tax=Polaribacter gangjinensis TaxID=574710 RepID=A0A2S7W8U2_9FLAO|nr:RimK/LysX family protein [Polaribacter gangjinensis]PQJ74037.1 peptidase [Polaribacter gangjinensis]
MKITIGRFDKADFKEFSLFDIDVKIDSGAYTSSIHCSNIEEITINNENHIKFTLLDSQHPFYNNKEYSTKNFAMKLVKSSNGITQKRYLIQTEIFIFNTSFPIHLTLSERRDMKFPVLLGRKFLNKRFVIDTSRTNISHKQKNNLI